MAHTQTISTPIQARSTQSPIFVCKLTFFQIWCQWTRLGILSTSKFGMGDTDLNSSRTWKWNAYVTYWMTSGNMASFLSSSTEADDTRFCNLQLLHRFRAYRIRSEWPASHRCQYLLSSHSRISLCGLWLGGMYTSHHLHRRLENGVGNARYLLCRCDSCHARAHLGRH